MSIFGDMNEMWGYGSAEQAPKKTGSWDHVYNAAYAGGIGNTKPLVPLAELGLMSRAKKYGINNMSSAGLSKAVLGAPTYKFPSPTDPGIRNEYFKTPNMNWDVIPGQSQFDAGYTALRRSPNEYDTNGGVNPGRVPTDAEIKAERSRRQ